ncbi:hypothetical protein G6F46_001694 [Rhizopus delemar]|nr:hypothetical protein G6F55_006913 [Rhizopus delemar]KAG1541471.1 hypothetical protein G6F51_007877 [Rhizopus arrhizus]KAG1494983.1 hypothetical protein G6F54_007497 [Rhizopus delemar]KAG1508960.1 hypothetical protein G6F53_007799 [Rhizopus delemar]KAG1524642.1 hypothetical protein G6F52_004029 [Rhizopus delemar]
MAYESGDITFSIMSTALVWLMIPGIGYFYSGMAREKNALSLIVCCLISLVIVSIQWVIWGYSLTFSKTANAFIGNLDNAFLNNILSGPSIGSDKVPDLLFCLYQGMFAALTPALVIGSGAERGRLLPFMLFIFIWSTLVYDPVACWTWNPHGWIAQLGVLDFAGGSPVHITSGFSSLAYALILGRRQSDEFKPHNMSNVILGTAFLWFGWFGFNGGSALSGNMRAVMACLVTNLAASVGAITWMCLDYRLHHKFSALGFCSGAIAGLVAITPGAGFVRPVCSIPIGILGALSCYAAVRLKNWLKYDDALDVFAVHGIGGMVGGILTGVFAESSIAALDGSTAILGGWMNRNWIQVGLQLVDVLVVAAWSFIVTYGILFLMNLIPGLSVRVDSESEIQGLDVAEIGEIAYDKSVHGSAQKLEA